MNLRGFVYSVDEPEAVAGGRAYLGFSVVDDGMRKINVRHWGQDDALKHVEEGWEVQVAWSKARPSWDHFSVDDSTGAVHVVSRAAKTFPDRAVQTVVFA